MRSLRGALVERRVETTIDGRDQRRRADDLAAEVAALRAEVRRLRQRCVDLWTPSGARQAPR